MSTLLTAGELTELQNEANRLLEESCIIRVPGSPVSDGAGGWTAGTATDSAATACSMRMPRQGNEQDVARQLSLVKPWIIMLPAGTSVNGNYQIVIGANTYEVAGVLEGGTREILRRVLVVEMST